MHRKPLRNILSVALILLLTIGLLLGCGQTSLTSTKSDLTANQAAELVYNDLTYHGIGIGKVSVTNLTFSDPTTATADVTYATADGKNSSQKVTLKKVNGLWEILGHEH